MSKKGINFDSQRRTRSVSHIDRITIDITPGHPTVSAMVEEIGKKLRNVLKFYPENRDGAHRQICLLSSGSEQVVYGVRYFADCVEE